MPEVRVTGGSLFERIREAAKPSVRRKPEEALLRSIQSNLRNVLNTRSGSCYGSPELGISDLNDESLASQNIRNATARMIRECTRRYEPRVSCVMVTTGTQDEYAPLELRFHIVAYVGFFDTRNILEFDILLDNHQHWSVEVQ
ncbi:type VI secretion system baseplate subunit TssE [Salmonella enterica]|nr:type VI secretion system baseplate subunit TssE [Salmonella enterica]EIM0325982.1 type VI secretion system baseplate subunit TssE [Salmonella enterica]EIR3068348.1 type VI secretion system baseplate subunit TssE [Salmonella enterica]